MSIITRFGRDTHQHKPVWWRLQVLKISYLVVMHQLMKPIGKCERQRATRQVNCELKCKHYHLLRNHHRPYAVESIFGFLSNILRLA